ncbi:phosphoglucosamine mutase [Caproicibacterium amylolyticum]|jgi:phosphoglucosamine mutase|uniref:Phosphoglucosamine mutase n=1 Tax=Caproicibacterium amylolyticum TaxID=2766537 RepID=A0A7G9WFB9_9FIRM|nr:phosphoglucosamine mutase [Caproicibacterium amylolyticum]MBE6721259.1 phosphoglucosamine mutase [Oscillospiraceae bacterium]QNO17381.1 phosphoglucosamine mutase [Caproicibacterium amylolyticum]
MGRLFGTDGVRGVANSELTCELALKIGRAAAYVLTDSGNRHPKILIGKDTRISSDMLEASITAGLCSVGADVVQLGVIPTPAVAYLVGKYKADAGVMLTASHNPCQFNGIKIFSGDGYKLPDALEDEIEDIILHNAEKLPVPVGGDIGTVTTAPNAVRDYVNHIKSTVPFSLDGLRIGIDCANGAASSTAEVLFTELGAQCCMISNHPNGVNVNDNCGSTHMENLMAFVRENGLDAGVAFDGDADRCLAVDDKGNLVDGDFVMAICSADMKSRGKLAKDTAVGTIMTNMGFSRFCEANGMHFEATKVGDRYVLEKMQQEGYNFGGEQSGHVIFLDFATTGDGQLTAAQLLSILKRRQAKLSSLATLMTRFPQVLINVEVAADGKQRFAGDETVQKAVEAAKQKLGNDGRIIVRPSGTEPLLRVMVEGLDKELIHELAENVAEVLKERLA